MGGKGGGGEGGGGDGGGGKGGGGRKDFAQAGGLNQNKIEEAFKEISKKIS